MAKRSLGPAPEPPSAWTRFRGGIPSEYFGPHLSPIWPLSGPIWAHGALLGPFWALSAPFGAHGALWGPLGPFFGPLGPILGPLGSYCAHGALYNSRWTALGGLLVLRVQGLPAHAFCGSCLPRLWLLPPLPFATIAFLALRKISCFADWSG